MYAYGNVVLEKIHDDPARFVVITVMFVIIVIALIIMEG